MKMKTLFMAVATVVLSISTMAQSNSDLLHISKMNVNKGDSLITLNMTVDPKQYRIGSNDIITLTPLLVAGTDTLPMQQMRFAGRGAWFAEVREGNATPQSIRRAGKGTPTEYSATVAYGALPRTSNIIIKADTTSVCNCNPPRSGEVPVVEINENPKTDFLQYAHNFKYIAPKDTADKIFNLSGRANIIFKVNRTDIDWTYFSNHAELDSIVKSVNAVRDNEYASVDTILLTGYASPEGPYANNVRLAIGRTEVVKKYVEAHSSFPPHVYHTASVPEDWQGLREWIVANNIDNKEAMLAFIDDPSIPDADRNDIFRARFPKEYPFLLKNVYPVLRHTDYRIRYRIRKFYDVDEIAAIFAKNPKLLSLNELYLLSGRYQPGSPEYYKVFLTAASMFPDSDVANLNAAGCAMSLDDYQTAKMYLAKTAPSAESYYAWGVLYAMEENYPEALKMLRKAKEAGSEKAAGMIPEVEAAMNPMPTITLL